MKKKQIIYKSNKFNCHNNDTHEISLVVLIKIVLYIIKKHLNKKNNLKTTQKQQKPEKQNKHILNLHKYITRLHFLLLVNKYQFLAYFYGINSETIIKLLVGRTYRKVLK